MPLGPWITQEDKAAVMAVLDRGDLMSGREVAAFEEELAAYFGKRHAVCVSSGTAALECAMKVRREAVINPRGFIALKSAAIAAAGMALPSEGGIATDVLGEQWNTKQRVHDCAHRFDKLAAHAEVSCFSFAPNKFIACGGGVLVTNDSVTASCARQYRNHGRDGGPEIFSDGRNLRMGEMNAALGRSQLRRIGEIMQRRWQVAYWYDDITGQKIASTRESWFLYPWPGQPELAKKHRSLADFRLFDTATQEDRETALLPIFPMMTKADCEEVCRG